MLAESDYEDLIRPKSSYIIRSLAIGGLVLTFVLLVAMMLPTMLLILSGGGELLFPKQKYVLVSPDDRFVMRVYRRLELPVDSIIDPSARISITIEEKATARIITDKKFSIHEYPELTEPIALWSPDSVYVREIEWHKEIEFEIPIR